MGGLGTGSRPPEPARPDGRSIGKNASGVYSQTAGGETALLRHQTEGAAPFVEQTVKAAVVADPHPDVRSALGHVLTAAGFSVAASVATPWEARSALERERPHLLTTELQFGEPISAALELIRDARRRFERIKVLVLTQTDDSDAMSAAFSAGAAAYVLKRADPRDCAAAIRQMFDRSIVLAPAGHGRAQPTNDFGLTTKEVEILRYIAAGDRNRELARRLWVTEPTVKFYLSSIYRKLGATNRTQAVHVAAHAGLLPRLPTDSS
jgi:DNA-binding NarL/FixJ family response regulator